MSRKYAEQDQPLIVRASLSKPFRVSSSWSVSPPSQHRFTALANRDSLRCLGPSSVTCLSSSGPTTGDTPNITVLGDRLSATWPADSFAAATCTTASPASVACDCRHEMFVAFSCGQRCLCPSCHQKRTLVTGETIAGTICAPVPHRQLVFTIPKRLRIYCRDDRAERYAESIRLLGELKKQGISGGVYTQTTDVEGEINGLMTYDRKVIKISAEDLATLQSENGL